MKSDEEESITHIGLTDWRNEQRPFGIWDSDRLQHIYVIGKTGVGKSTLLLNMAISDIQKGKGIAVIDPHGDLAEELLNHIPQHRIKECIYFNPADIDFPIAYNPLHSIHPTFRHLVASGIISTFKKLYSESWGPRMEYILKFALLTILEYPHATFLDIQPLLTNPVFRSEVLTYVKQGHIHSFWKNEFDKMSPHMRNEAISPILNKLGIFQTSEPLRRIFGQKTSSFRMGQLLNEGKILIANLSKGTLGEDTSTIIGSILINGLQLSAISRASQESKKRRPFFLYVDEAHSFITHSFADMLSEARKYGLSLFLTHQYISQFNEKVIAAIFGNVGTIISFRVGQADAEILSKEFYPTFSQSDLVNLPRYSMYLKLMIDGATSKPFSALTESIPPIIKSFKKEVIESSRKHYGKLFKEPITPASEVKPESKELNLFS